MTRVPGYILDNRGKSPPYFLMTYPPLEILSITGMVIAYHSDKSVIPISSGASLAMIHTNIEIHTFNCMHEFGDVVPVIPETSRH